MGAPLPSVLAPIPCVPCLTRSLPRGRSPQDWAGAIVVRRKLTFSTPGIDPECYEPAWANLEPGVKGDMAHGVLLSLEDEDLAKLDQAWAPRGAERATIKTMAYDRRSLEAVAHVVPDERAARGLRPSARHLEVLLEAARLRSLDPKWIYHLEAEVPSPLYTPPPVGEGTRVLMPEEVPSPGIRPPSQTPAPAGSASLTAPAFPGRSAKRTGATAPASGWRCGGGCLTWQQTAASPRA